MVELRKRKAAPPAPEPPAKKKAAPKASKGGVAKAEQSQAKAGEGALSAAAAAKARDVPKVGDTIALAGFGGTIETHDGYELTLQQLVEDSESGVVLFTYPKANTPGCK